jgi:NADPH-dependent 2,4-dienoyl-CoA reductase/sulfur reductase-like enzyme
MPSARVLIIGGDAAGMSAASRVRKRLPDSEVVVYEAGDYVSYSACGMPFHVAGIVREFGSLLHYTVDKFEKERRIEIRLHSRVTRIDTQRKEIEFYRNGVAAKDHFDRLIIATGASPKLPPVLEGVKIVRTLRTLNDLDAFEKLARSASHITIVGAGYIGLELSESFRMLGKDVRIIQRSDRILRGYNAELSKMIVDEVAGNGVHIDFNTEIERVEEKGSSALIRTKDGAEFSTDMIVAATGVAPNSAIASSAGIELGASGAVRVNEYMETSVPGIFAAGDVATTFNMITGESIYMPLATGSNKSGRVAGENAAGGRVRWSGVAGTEVVKVFSLEVGRTGIDEREAASHGFEPVSATVTSTTRSSYYPGGGPLTIRLTADRRSHRFLGGNIIGKEGVAKRLDVLATAIASSMTVDQMINVDYSYSPPFAPAWEPVGVAADVLSGLLHDRGE